MYERYLVYLKIRHGNYFSIIKALLYIENLSIQYKYMYNAVKWDKGFHRIMIFYNIKKYHLYFIILDTCCVKKWQLRWGQFWRRWNLGMPPTSSLMSLFFFICFIVRDTSLERGTLTSIRILRLVKIPTLYHDWLRALK